MKNINGYALLVIIAFIIRLVIADANQTIAISKSLTRSSESDLPDFDFDNDQIDDYYYSDGMIKFIDKSDTVTKDHIESTLFGDVQITNDEHVSAFAAKEQRVRSALLRATKDSSYRKKFVQIMPILRSLSKQQRLVLAALVSAQTGSLTGKTELNMAQVEAMFGDRKKLILPLVFDIANLVKTAAAHASKQYHKYTPYPLGNSEKMPEPEFLKRIDTVNSSPVNNLKNDRFLVEDGESKIKNIVATTANQNSNENIAPMKKDRAMAQTRNDNRSYHERKLNMTNFNVNGTKDQHAMESTVQLQIAIPKSLINQSNLTLEEYEELAFHQLNGTIKSVNGSLESLPMPEMLISRYRVKQPYRKFAQPTGGLDSGLKACEQRFGTLCLRVDDYPITQIMGSIRRHKHAMSALLAEYTDKDDYEYTTYLQEITENNNKRREDDDHAPGTMCPSIVRYARPQKARSAAGEWKFIVNTGQHTQTLRLEKCSKPEEPCTYLTDNFRSRCVQVFNYHRLLSWDNSRGLHVDIFKVPTCCSCHIDGYKEKFPPLNSYSSGGLSNHDLGLTDDYRFSASNIHSHNSHYSTIVNDDVNDDDDDDEASIAYQYSNGFKRSPVKYNKFTDTTLLLPSSSSTKPRYETKNKKQSLLNGAALDSYLTPPTINEFDTLGTTFKRGPSSGKRHRRPVRTHIRDQSLSGSEFLPDITVIPTHEFNTERSPINGIKRKSTTPITSTQSEISTKRMSTTGRLPSISTASTSNVDLGKRVNYNYHPIIDFFGDSVKSEKEIDDRVGYSNSGERAPNWRPVQLDRRRRV